MLNFHAVSDFRDITSNVTLQPEETSCVSIDTYSDNTFEPTEQFFIKLTVLDENIHFEQPTIQISILNAVCVITQMAFHNATIHYTILCNKSVFLYI